MLFEKRTMDGENQAMTSEEEVNLNQIVMYVSSTADQGVVDTSTRLRFMQKGSRVMARYSGGAVSRGCLIGALSGSRLVFRYTQIEASGAIHGGHSICDVERRPDHRIRIVEHFAWHTRPGYGTNVFEEVDRLVTDHR
jgi:hypothetical protein